jgi:hypothetical protein
MTQQTLFDLVFAGAVLDGFSEEQVKINFAKHLKLTQAKVDKLFTGKRITLKKSISKSKAEDWQRKLLKIGAETVMVPALNFTARPINKAASESGSLFDSASITQARSERKVTSEKDYSKLVNAKPNSRQNSPRMGASQQEYDEQMQQRIIKAQAMIEAQQMQQQSENNQQGHSFKRLSVFSMILFAAVLFLYFYVESIS